jgi:hypothetical protein
LKQKMYKSEIRSSQKIEGISEETVGKTKAIYIYIHLPKKQINI